MKKVLRNMNSINGNTVADIYQKFNGSTPGFDLNFNLVSKDISITAFVDNELVNGDATININSSPEVVGNVTDLAFATTVFHEAIHANIAILAENFPNVAKKTYPKLFTWFSSLKGNQNDEQHALFAEKHIEDIAKSVEQLGKKLGYFYDYQFYKDLAWKGLTGTNAFLKKNPNQMDRDRIINTIKAEQYGITTNGIPQRGTRLNCGNI